MGPRPQPPLAMASHLVKANIKYFLVVWLLLFLGVAIATTIVGSLTNPSMSILDFTTTPPRYWILAIGILFPGVITRVYVAHGVTRKDLSTAALLAAAAISVVLGLLMAAAFGIEHLVYQANGWDAVIEGHLFGTSGQFGLVLGEFTVIYAGHFLAGWTIGLLFARFETITALALLIPAYLPAAVIEWLLGSGWAGAVWVQAIDGARLPSSAAIAICLVVLSAQAGLNHTMMRAVPVGIKRN